MSQIRHAAKFPTPKRGPYPIKTSASSRDSARMSASPPKADIRQRDCHVCFVPKAGIKAAFWILLLVGKGA
jgi:hypothetical protein